MLNEKIRFMKNKKDLDELQIKINIVHNHLDIYSTSYMSLVSQFLEQIYPDFRQPKKAPKKAAPVDEPKADEEPKAKERLPPTVLEQLKMGRGVRRVRPAKYK